MPRYTPVDIDDVHDEFVASTDEPVATIIGEQLLTVTIGDLRIACHPDERGFLIVYKETEE